MLSWSQALSTSATDLAYGPAADMTKRFGIVHVADTLLMIGDKDRFKDDEMPLRLTRVLGPKRTSESLSYLYTSREVALVTRQ